MPVSGRGHGSSPRVRGTVTEMSGTKHKRRFIPACAGNSGDKSSSRDFVPVHPRVCGEQLPIIDPAARSAGSSPRVRGTARKGPGACRKIRFIPACAGNRSVTDSLQCLYAVHPRVCGEQILMPFKRRSANGSSPRVRGTVSKTRGCFCSPRFIPACAGNSFSMT